MCEVICPYKDKCSQYQKLCATCKHNTGKRSYYIPDPCYPWYPYYEPYKPIWITTTTDAGNYYTDGNTTTAWR